MEPYIIPLNCFQLDNLIEGKAWVKFTKVENFVRKDKERKTTLVQKIVEDEKKKLGSDLRKLFISILVDHLVLKKS